MENSATASLIPAILGGARCITSLIECNGSLLKGETFPAPIAGISPDTGRIRRFSQPTPPARRQIPCEQGICPASLRVERCQIVRRELVPRIAEFAGHGRHRFRAHLLDV